MEEKLRLTARVAPYLNVIGEKRRAGWTWGNIKDALGGLNCTPHGLAQAVKNCRWVVEQLPLPGGPAAVVQPQPAVQQSAQPAQPAQQGSKKSNRIDLEDPANQL